MKKLDKKQVPQFAALCILSAGLFGYFVVRMVSPSPAAAGTLPRPTAEAAKPASPAPQTATTPGAVTTAATPGAATTAAASTAATPTEDAVPPPTPGMRDPFVISAIDTKASPAGPAPAPFAAPTAAPKPTHPATQVVSLPTVRPLPIPDAPALPSPLTNFTVKPRGDAVLPPTAPPRRSRRRLRPGLSPASCKAKPTR